MNRPGLLTRFAASLPGASVILVFCAALVAGWCQGQDVPWWIALGAVFGAGRVLRAMRTMRRYQTWRAQWEAMSDGAPVRQRGNKRVQIALAVVILCTLSLIGTINNPEMNRENQAALVALPVLIGGSAIYLMVSFGLMCVRPLRRRAVARKEKAMIEQVEKTNMAPVSWLLPVPSSSPSCADAARNLPEYAAKLLRS